MATEWDLYDYDPWDEWYSPPGARETMRDDACIHMRGVHEDRAWAEEDEEIYLAALLVAGAEPEDYNHDAHQAWQQRVASILMQKYRRHWWFEWTVGERVHGDPKYRHKAQTCRASVQVDELRKFYTWLCSERGEPWTANIVPIGQSE